MTISLDQAKAIVQAATVDIWNTPSKADRLKIWQKFFAEDVKAYAPNGVVTTGYEEGDKHYDGLHADGRENWRFRAEEDSEIWHNGTSIMQRWFYGIGDEGWKGWDVIIVDGDGKVKLLYGLMDGVHNHPPAM